MAQLFAGVFASIGLLFGGLFGGHPQMPPMASSTQMHGMHSASSTDGWNGHTGSTTPWQSSGNGTSTPGHMGMVMPGVFGTVTAINGNILSVSGHGGPKTATTTFTVDATNAKILKVGAPGSKTSSTTVSVSSIRVNDMVAVMGTVSGTTITAKTIIDGIMGMMGMDMGAHGGPMPMPPHPTSQY